MENETTNAVAVIPARWDSSRFPGKPLALIAGRPMIAHVVERARGARRISSVIVATDDRRVFDAAVQAGAEAVMTGECASGTDRVAAAALCRDDWQICVNVQGDEPLLSARNIDVLVGGMAAAPRTEMATLCRPLDLDRVTDPNAVKVVRRADGRALYFSRAQIPYPRRVGEAAVQPRLHLGIYGYRRAGLETFVGLAPSPLERTESLEQLRALEHGMEILVLDAPDPAFGVDTPEDLERAEQMMRRRQAKGD